MNKFITLLLAFSMTLAISQGCSTFLTTHLGIPVLSSSEPASGLNFCKSIKDSDTCCSAETVNGFEERTNALLATLTTSVSNRDKMIIRARKTAFALRGALSRIQEAAPKVAENLANYNPVPNTNTNVEIEIDFDPSEFLEMTNAFDEIGTLLTGNLTDLVGSFDTFQEKRKECVVELVKIQTSAWCLACHPNQANFGVGANSLTLNAALNQKIVDACAPFIVASAAQNAFIGLHFMAGMLNGMANGFEKMARNDIEGGMNDIVMAMFSMLSGGIAEPSDDEKPATLPEDCSETNCPWIFQSLFANGLINVDLLAAGGIIEESYGSSGGFDFSRLLFGKRHYDDDDEEVIVKVADRKLTDWNPDDDESGITVTFETNPGNVQNDENSLSGLRNAVVGFSIAVLAVLFF